MKFSSTLLTCLLASSTVFSYTLNKRDDFTDKLKESQGDIDKQMEQMKEEMEKMQGSMGNLPTGSTPELPSTNTGSTPELPNLGSSTNSTSPTDFTTTSNTSFGQLQNSDVFNEECQKVIAEYYSCLPKKMTDKNYDECCNVYNSEKCVNIYKKKLSENDACKNGTEDVEKQIAMMSGLMDLSCAKHNGKYCPISKLNKEGKEITQSTLEDTCKSQECLQKGVSGLEASKQWVQMALDVQNKVSEAFSHQKRANANTTPQEAVSKIDGYLNELKSEKCSAQAASGAISLKAGNLFVLSLGLFLYYLL
ncbi:hypothetical protein BCR32DRAFT_325744 [Anaeromyces robustus]|uniref:Extracellular membrane protein CFEM domain-containing protein n=1 Tax=Anaeromyces robustus TaxID=1754192 RepID=A0A1Y1XGG5_9FUNG|nr:hypothetical protein BCR32DRAFT_325744 [Anaeromyces robustus]|eukprot:ORX84835.1 hypothetical protein BCR32DRAFT_325744 [Anaeromyces robustus]